MFLKSGLLASLAVALAASASGQVLILGNSLGKECFEGVAFSQSPAARHERACTSAINSGTLDRRNLTATHINRGIVRMRLGNIDGALEDYARAKEMRPEMGEIYLNEGAALISRGDVEAGKAAIEKALELGTQDEHAAYYNLGLAYEKLGNPTEAYFSYRKALDLRPGWDLAERELERFTVKSEES